MTNFTQLTLCSEGFWNAFVKGTAQVLNSALPELTRPINQLDSGLKNVGRAIATGWRGTKGSHKAPKENTYSPHASKYAVYEYKGKYYKQDLNSPVVKKPAGTALKVWEVDPDTGHKTNYSLKTMWVDTHGEIFKVF